MLGKHLFGRGSEYANNEMNHDTYKNRELLREFCDEHDLNVLNTRFEHKASKFCTYAEKGTELGPPWDPKRYVQKKKEEE